jgi:putative transposase
MEQEYHLEFFTATMYKWYTVLQFDECKDVIIDSLKFLVKNNRVKVYAYVIMPNHIHLLWKVQKGHKRENVQRDFLKFTAQQIRFFLQKNYPEKLEKLNVNLKDRKYQIWQRNSLSKELWGEKNVEQKLDYIHHNPCQGKWNLCKIPENYDYSSAKFYLLNIKNLKTNDVEFLTHYKD